jgi:UDP-N-acetylmuramyl pentapeptide synthase
VLRTADGKFTLIDESYNASPVSMKAAIEVLGETEPGSGGRRIAVLGDMLELGQGSAWLHAGLIDVLEKEAIDLVFTAGDQMAHLAKALDPAMCAGHASNMSLLKAMVIKAIQPGDVVVVKGSAGSKTGIIVQAFLNLNQKYAVNGD